MRAFARRGSRTARVVRGDRSGDARFRSRKSRRRSADALVPLAFVRAFLEQVQRALVRVQRLQQRRPGPLVLVKRSFGRLRSSAACGPSAVERTRVFHVEHHCLRGLVHCRQPVGPTGPAASLIRRQPGSSSDDGLAPGSSHKVEHRARWRTRTSGLAPASSRVDGAACFQLRAPVRRTSAGRAVRECSLSSALCAAAVWTRCWLRSIRTVPGVGDQAHVTRPVSIRNCAPAQTAPGTRRRQSSRPNTSPEANEALAVLAAAITPVTRICLKWPAALR